MTRRRADVSASLAERGRPENWATEDEAAALSGMSRDRFNALLLKLHAAGFPQRTPWNGKRWIPAILDFWWCQHQSGPSKTAHEVDDEERAKENFGKRSPR
jgi:hypothetical protein